MINLPYSEIISKIKEKSQLSEEDIEKKVKEKMDQLSGLISKEGAAYIVANDIGVQLVQAGGAKKIKDIFPGMRGIETTGKVTRVFPINEFERNGNKGKVGSFLMADETSQIRVTAWNDMTSILSDLNQGDIVKIQDGFIKNNQGRTEIHVNSNTKFEKNPEGVEISVEVPEQGMSQSPERKSISKLAENDFNVEVMATVVQVFDPKFFPTCPTCSKKLTQASGDYNCPEHGVVTPKFGVVINIVLDDGTDNIRAVFFRENVLRLFDKNEEEMDQIRQAPDKFESLRTAILGETIKVRGKVSRNQMFDRLELVGNMVQLEVDPKKEIENIKNSEEKGEDVIPSVDDL
ncbi:MAG: OB-fold nucleic acid binding domain-containing protein [Nanobdellota archaeon]